MKFNGPEPKSLHYHIRVDRELYQDVEKYNIHKSASAREGLRLAVEKAKKEAKKKSKK